MKNTLKKMIPKRLLPLAQKIYSRWFVRPRKIDVSQEPVERASELQYTIASNQYGRYCIPESSKHRPAAEAILSNSVYEPETIEFMVSNCGSGNIVHAGTYFGDFLPALSKALAPGAVIWAFEPNQENFACVRMTVELNQLANVVLTKAGLGSKTGYKPIQTIDENGIPLGGSSRIISSGAGDHMEIV